jgi:pimeloyl-ACP methyl ester carboxylesterase
VLVLACLNGAEAAPPEALSLDDLTFARSEVFAAETAEFRVAGHKAFLVRPPRLRPDGTRPWIWYAPTLTDESGAWKLPGLRHMQLIKPALDAGCHFCGVDVGESYGSPAGRETFTAFYRVLVDELGLDCQAMLFPVSRGGLMHYNWAVEHPEWVRCIGAVYPVCNLTSYPRLERAAKTYGITPEELKQNLSRHNPVDRLAPLADKGVRLFNLHGDQDAVVPLADNSGLLAKRYRELGGPIELAVVAGKGHEIVPEFWENPRLAAFFKSCLAPHDG